VEVLRKVDNILTNSSRCKKHQSNNVAQGKYPPCPVFQFPHRGKLSSPDLKKKDNINGNFALIEERKKSRLQPTLVKALPM